MGKKSFVCLVKGHALRYVPFLTIGDGMLCDVCGAAFACDNRGCGQCPHVNTCEDYLRWGSYNE